jgi:tRNA pseudouridine38-40 synthase
MPANVPPAPVAAPGGGLRRLCAVLAYEGTNYHGWARQPGLATIEQAVLAALTSVLRVDDMSLVCAGRTDAGVHARGQVIHVDVPADTDPLRLRNGLNALLPDDIRCWSVAAAPPHFDARFAALWRRYQYRVTDTVPDPLARHTVLAVRHRLDVAAMADGAQRLLGEHDFTGYCKPRPHATAVRTLLECTWRRDSDGCAVLDVRADAFCHSMVRSIVGASLQVGAGRRPPEWMHDLLAAASRAAAAPVAPAHGLVLVEVGYPAPELMAQRVAVARQLRRGSAQGAAPLGPPAGEG